MQLYYYWNCRVSKLNHNLVVVVVAVVVVVDVFGRLPRVPPGRTTIPRRRRRPFHG